MLDGHTLWRLASATQLPQLALLEVLDVLVLLLVELEPLHGGEVLPRVQMADAFSLDLLVRALLGAELIDEIILLLLSEHLNLVIKVLLNEIESNLKLLLHVGVTSLLSLVLKCLDAPQAEVTQDWSEVHSKSGQEVLVAESDNLIEEVLKLDSNHPDLLVVEESTRPVIKPVFAQCCAESYLKLLNESFVHVLNILLLFDIDTNALGLDPDGSQLLEVILEQSSQLLEVGHSSHNCVHEVGVGLCGILVSSILTLFATVDEVKLVQTLTVASSCCHRKVLDGLLDVL